MVVVVIIGMLAALVGVRVLDNIKQARITGAKAQIKNFSQALQLYHLNNGFFPTTDQGLSALVSKPTTPPEPRNYQRGGYLEGGVVPKDSWGNDYIYLCPGQRGEFDIISLGSDGREGGEDDAADISNMD
jgi:general secretion pathway protein G